MYKCLHFSNLSRHLGLSDSIALPGKLVVLQSDCRQEVFLILETSVTNEYNNNNNNKQSITVGAQDEALSTNYFKKKLGKKKLKVYIFYSSIFLRHQTMDKVQKYNSFKKSCIDYSKRLVLTYA